MGTLLVDGFPINYIPFTIYENSATDPVYPPPDDGDLYYNTTLKMLMSYDDVRSKWLSIESFTFYVGGLGTVPTGEYYQGVDGRTFSAADGHPAPHNGTVVEFGYTRTDTDVADFEVTADGVTVETINSSAVGGTDTTLDGDVDAGEVLAVRNKAGGNITSNVQAWTTLKWRA